MNRLAAIPIVVVLVLAVSVQTSGRAAVQDQGNQAQAVSDALVNFGSPQPQPTPVQLSHELVPNEVTITKGGTVTFRFNGGGHGMAIHEVSKNTTRDDITNQLCVHDAVTHLCVDPTFAVAAHQIVDGKGSVVIDVGTNPPLARLDDPTDRLLGTAVVVEESNGTLVPGAFHTGTAPGPPPTAGTQIQYRFAKTGRYLVICMNRAHSLNDWMFGFVNVVDDEDAQ
jgi:plastocyanin